MNVTVLIRGKLTSVKVAKVRVRGGGLGVVADGNVSSETLACRKVAWKIPFGSWYKDFKNDTMLMGDMAALGRCEWCKRSLKSKQPCSTVRKLYIFSVVLQLESAASIIGTS